MTPDQRMKWDAKAAFKRMNDKLRHHAVEPHEYIGGYTVPYTPPSNIGPERLAQLRKYEHPAKPKGRDYDAILRAAKKAPVGYYEDAPRGMKFGSVGKMVIPTPGQQPLVGAGSSPAAPTPPHSADGGQPLPSAGSKPHGKDVDTADGPWPKRIMGAAALGILEGPHKGTAYYRSGTVCCISCKGLVDSWLNALQGSYRLASEAEALQWLEQNGHKDVAAQLRGTPRADVATGGGRVWKNRAPRHLTETCYEHWRAVLIDGKVCTRGAWNKPGVWSGEANDVPSLQELESGSYPELFGPERDAILAECRKAMGLDTSTVRVTISTAPRAEMDCKTRRELKQTYVKIEMATGLIIPCDETDPNRIGYVR